MVTMSASLAPFCQPYLVEEPAPLQLPAPQAAVAGRPRVVVLGCGEAAGRVVEGLRNAAVDVKVLDARDGMLVQPLVLEAANARLLLREVTGIDTRRRCVEMEAGRELAYDRLVIAADRARANTPADAIRVRMELAVDYAEAEPDAVERQRLLTFVVVGAGPIGVELALSLAALADQVLADAVRSVGREEIRVVLAEKRPHLLPGFADAMRRERQCALARAGVEVRLGAEVIEVAADHAGLDGERIETRTVISSVSAAGSACARWQRAHADRHGRVPVTAALTVPGEPDVFVLRGARDAGRVARAIRRELGTEPAGMRRAPLLDRLAGTLDRIVRRSRLLPS